MERGKGGVVVGGGGSDYNSLHCPEPDDATLLFSLLSIRDIVKRCDWSFVRKIATHYSSGISLYLSLMFLGFVKL